MKLTFHLYLVPRLVQHYFHTVIPFVGHVARMCEERGVCIGSWWETEGRRPLGRPRRR